MLGPGLEILGPGHLCHIAPSEGYSVEYGLDEVDWATWPSTAPPLTQVGIGIEGGGFWSSAIETCLTANGYDVEVRDRQAVGNAMAALEQSGAPAGRRFFTLRGLLRYWVDRC